MDKLEHKLNVIQSIISRMANNSSNCKLWCITILTGIIVFYFQEHSIDKLIVLLPVIPFFLLDSYYLGIEKYYIRQYEKLFTTNNIDNIIPHGKFCERLLLTIKSLFSFSVLGFYLLIAVILLIIIK